MDQVIAGASLLAAIAGTLLLCSIASAQTAPASQPAGGVKAYVTGVDGQRPTPRLAVDNVCAWPNLVVLPGGEIVAIIFNQPIHGLGIGEVECWASADEGQTWQKRGTVAAPERGTLTNRMNVAAGLASNGDLIVLCSGWSLAPKEGAAGTLKLVSPLRTWVCRSSDGGRTWAVEKEAVPATSPEGETFVPHGAVLPGADGALRVAMYTGHPRGSGGPWHSYVLRSDDDGHIWSQPQPLDAKRPLNETFIFHTGGGHWVAVARHSRLDLFESDDDARTWRCLGPLTEEQAFPGQIMKLRDGRLLLSNGNRAKGDEHVEVRLSGDEGKSWSAPLRVMDILDHDGGYPSSVQLPDGTILTAFYARKTAEHDGYHMAVATWRAPDALTKP